MAHQRESNRWVAKIFKGSTNCDIGAIVTTNVPPGTIVIGVPAKV